MSLIDTAVPRFAVHDCPRCGHRWEGECAGIVHAEQASLFEVAPEPIPGLAESAAEMTPNGQGAAVPSAPPSEQLLLNVAHEKPPYRIPAMREIAAVPWNGLSVVSTFSGCGGSCLGFKMAGFRALVASEFVPAAVETYRANFPDVPVIVQDVRDVEPAVVMERIGIKQGELDVLEGSPPCASFSTAGRREAGWGQVKKYSDVKQRTDDLFDEYIRLVSGFRPRVFVAENVPGFLFGAADHFRRWVEGMLTDLGYLVWHQVLDAAQLGVPQRRRRVIIIGVRRDVPLHPASLYPRALPYTYSVRDAIGELTGALVIERPPSAERFQRASLLETDEPMDPIRAGIGHGASVDQRLYRLRTPTEEELAEASIERYAIGDEWERMGGPGKSERYFSLVRPDEDEPLPTVTQTGGNIGAASVTHPTEKRKFTIAELRRLSGFPDDFVLTGSYGQQWERIGRAVPPPMMAAVARKIAEALNELDRL